MITRPGSVITDVIRLRVTQSIADKIVFAHPDVITSGLIGYARCTDDGHLELYPSVDTVNAELQQLTLARFIERDSSVMSLANLRPLQHAWRWESNAEFTVARLPTGDTHYMQAFVLPNDDHPGLSEIESAMIECWVRCRSPENALEIVRESLNTENWTIRQIDGPKIHTEDDYIDERELMQYFEQVQTDGEVFVYHITPTPNA